jgi:hypothetical protein
MLAWGQINLTWEQLSVLPTRWKGALSQWRGIYSIFDTSDAKGYVGSASPVASDRKETRSSVTHG